MRKHKIKSVVYMGFKDLEIAYDIVNRAALQQVLRIYYVSGKLLGGIKSMYVDSLACVRVKGGETGVSCPLDSLMYIWMQW